MTLIDSKTAGSRYASKVRIAVPGGSVYNGLVGLVVTVIDGTVMVRLYTTFSSSSSTTLPFALSDLKVLR